MDVLLGVHRDVFGAFLTPIIVYNVECSSSGTYGFVRTLFTETGS